MFDKKIESHDLNNIYISPPDIIDWNEVNRFFIKGIRLKKVIQIILN